MKHVKNEITEEQREQLYRDFIPKKIRKQIIRNIKEDEIFNYDGTNDFLKDISLFPDKVQEIFKATYYNQEIENEKYNIEMELLEQAAKEKKKIVKVDSQIRANVVRDRLRKKLLDKKLSTWSCK